VEKRIIPYSDDEIKLSALSQIETEIVGLSKILPFERLTSIVNLWYNGIVRQVTNHPPDIMIEKWLFNDYPGIRPLQRKSLENQLRAWQLGLVRVKPASMAAFSLVRGSARLSPSGILEGVPGCDLSSLPRLPPVPSLVRD